MKGLVLQNLTPGTPSKKPKNKRKEIEHLVDGELVTLKQICKDTGRDSKSVKNFMDNNKCSLQTALAKYDVKHLNSGNLSKPKAFQGFII